MSTKDPTQTVVLYSYNVDGVKLAHIGIFRDQFSSGKPNTGIKISSQIGKAKWAQKQFELGNNDSHQESAEHIFDSGFYVMLMNTDKEMWESNVLGTGLDLTEAYLLRETEIRKLRAEHFVTTNPRRYKNNTVDGKIGNKGWGATIKGKLTANSSTLEKIHKVCETLTVGMKFESLEDYKAIRRVVYDKVVGKYGKGEIRKSEVWAMFVAISVDAIEENREELVA